MTRTVKGAKVLITGAASGMGLLYARRAVAEGASAVALWDVDAEALERAAEELRAAASGQTAVTPYIVDLTEPGMIAAVAQRVRRQIGIPDILINNAGMVTGKFFWEHDPDRDIERTIKVNTLAPMLVTREFLPGMIADAYRKHRIVNIASAAGLLANPRMSVYAASKWAVVGWSDSLRIELKQQDHSNVKVTTVTPSYVSTGMFAGARGPLLTPVLTPDYVVERVWRGMLRAKPFVMVPGSVRLATLLRGILPVRVWDTVATWMGIYSSMDHFTGRRPTGQ